MDIDKGLKRNFLMKRAYFFSLFVLCSVFLADGTSAQMRVAESGRGEVLIFPFYSATQSNKTEFTIRNHKDHAKAVALRFREGRAGAEVLSFYLYLAPFDEFTAQIVANPNGNGAAVVTTDSSCTVPVLGTPNGNFSGDTSTLRGVTSRLQPFVPYSYYDDNSQDIERTLVGSFEVIELAQWNEGSSGFSLTGTNVFKDIEKSAAGDRAGCGALVERWRPGGIWNSSPSDSAIAWSGGGLEGELVAFVGDYGPWDLPPEESGDGAIEIPVIAIEGFAREKIKGEYHQSPGRREGVWPVPSLTNGTSEFFSPVYGRVDRARSGLDALSVLLAQTEVVANASANKFPSESEAIVSFPTKWHHSVSPIGPDAISPFETKWDPEAGLACESIGVDDTGDWIGLYPYSKSVKVHEICSAVNILSASRGKSSRADECTQFGCQYTSDSSEAEAEIGIARQATWLLHNVPEISEYPWAMSFSSSDFDAKASERYIGESQDAAVAYHGLPVVVIPISIPISETGEVQVRHLASRLMTASQDDSDSVTDNSGSGGVDDDGSAAGGGGEEGDGDGYATSGDYGGNLGVGGEATTDSSSQTPSSDGDTSSDASSGWGLTSSDATDSDDSVADDATATASAEHFAKLFLEVPADGGTYTGIGPIQGWALDDRGTLGSQIDFYIDGVYQGQIAHGDTRSDVGRAYPSVPNANLAGFSSAFTFSALSPGWHEIEIITAASNGKALRASARFRVVRFDAGSYLVGEDAPRFTERCVNRNGGILCAVKAGDITQAVTLKWSSATQSFEIVDIK